MNHNRYAFLDGIRGMAAIFVVTRHTSVYWNFSLFRSYLAVDLFFILSGFVIAYAYDKKIESGTITVPQFILIRLIRLYPVFLLSLLVCCVYWVVSHQLHQSNLPEFLAAIALTALFLPSHLTGNNNLFPINSPYWSLFYELIANFTYAAIRPFLNNFVLFTLIIVFGLSVVCVSYQQGNLQNGFLWGSESLIAGLSRSFLGIFLGLFIYRHQAKAGKYLNNPNAAWIAFFAIAIILSSPSVEKLDWVIDASSVTVVFPIAVLFASQGKSAKSHRILLMLGSISYPIYVLHLPVSAIVSSRLWNQVHAFSPMSGIVLVILLSAFSILIEKYYDIPLRRKISNYISRRRSN